MQIVQVCCFPAYCVPIEEGHLHRLNVLNWIDACRWIRTSLGPDVLTVAPCAFPFAVENTGVREFARVIRRDVNVCYERLCPVLNQLFKRIEQVLIVEIPDGY